MKYISLFILLIVISCSSNDKKDFPDAVAKLEGVWETNYDGVLYIEHWQKTEEDEFTGLALKVAGEDTFEVERIKFVNKSDDVFYVTDEISDNSVSQFLLADYTEHSLTFQNENKNKIIYDFSRDGLLTISKTTDTDVTVLVYNKKR